MHGEKDQNSAFACFVFGLNVLSFQSVADEVATS